MICLWWKDALLAQLTSSSGAPWYLKLISFILIFMYLVASKFVVVYLRHNVSVAVYVIFANPAAKWAAKWAKLTIFFFRVITQSTRGQSGVSNRSQILDLGIRVSFPGLIWCLTGEGNINMGRSIGEMTHWKERKMIFCSNLKILLKKYSILLLDFCKLRSGFLKN